MLPSENSSKSTNDQDDPQEIFKMLIDLVSIFAFFVVRGCGWANLFASYSALYHTILDFYALFPVQVPHTCFPIPPSRFFLGNFNNVPPLKKRRLSIIKSWHLHHQRLCIVHDKTFILKKNLYIHDFLSVQRTYSCIISCSHYNSTVISPLSLNFIMTKLRNSCYMNILIYRRVLLKLFIAYKYISFINNFILSQR